jgi:hypothetical protein
VIRLDGIRREIAGLVAEQKLRTRRKKPTTAEARQEIDRILAKVESLPADAPPHPDTRGLREAQRALDRVLAVLETPVCRHELVHPAGRPAISAPCGERDSSLKSERKAANG